MLSDIEKVLKLYQHNITVYLKKQRTSIFKLTNPPDMCNFNNLPPSLHHSLIFICWVIANFPIHISCVVYSLLMQAWFEEEVVFSQKQT